MPKSKCDQVVEHRISFQDYERKLLENYATAKTFEAAGKGAAYVGGVVAVGTAVYVGWWTLEKLHGWMGDAIVPDWVDPAFPVWSDENKENFRKENPSVWQQALKGPQVLWAMMTE